MTDPIPYPRPRDIRPPVHPPSTPDDFAAYERLAWAIDSHCAEFDRSGLTARLETLDQFCRMAEAMRVVLERSLDTEQRAKLQVVA